MNRPIHPQLLEWIQDCNKESLLLKLQLAEGMVGKYGTVTITYHDGKAVKFETRKTENIE